MDRVQRKNFLIAAGARLAAPLAAEAQLTAPKRPYLAPFNAICR